MKKDNVIEKAKEMSKNKYYLIGGVVLIFLIVLFLLTKSTPEKTTKNFLEALQSGDSKTISKVVWWNENNGYYDLEDIDTIDIIDDLAEDAEESNFKYKMGEIKIVDDEARVKIKIKKGSTSVRNGKIYLKKIHGKWKINIIKTLKKGINF
ncbi:MAG: DUF4878 domain-containing protein [Firmicutes bacterium]|nr:DUF4878 domain-containing protein [Bacillota bacterium]